MSSGRRTSKQVSRSRRSLILGIGAVLSFLIARPLLAADLTGTWEIASRTNGDRQVIALDVVQEGRSLSGRGVMWMERAGDSIQVEVRSGTVKSPDFQLVIIRSDGQALPPQVFIGSWYRDEMSGRVEGGLGPRMFAGDRQRLEQ